MHYLHGRITVGGVALEDLADSCGTPVSVAGVVVARVRSVICGRVTVDGEVEGECSVRVANRHSLQADSHFTLIGCTGSCVDVDLPCDVRAGDVVALQRRWDSGSDAAGTQGPTETNSDRIPSDSAPIGP